MVNEKVLKYKVVFYNDALLKMLGNIEPQDFNNLIKKKVLKNSRIHAGISLV